MSVGPIEIVGIAFVVRDPLTGETALYSSRDVNSIELEFTREPAPYPYLSSSILPRSTGINLSAHCDTISCCIAAPAPAVPNQRGIYLPDLSFRALPPPSD